MFMGGLRKAEQSGEKLGVSRARDAKKRITKKNRTPTIKCEFKAQLRNRKPNDERPSEKCEGRNEDEKMSVPTSESETKYAFL